MSKHVVTFSTKVDTQVLEKYNVDGFHVPKFINSIAICDLTDTQLQGIREETGVLSVEKDFSDEIDETTGQGESYAIDLMEVKRFHELGYKGQRVKVAIFDTGIQKHEDLEIAGGINAYDQSQPYDADLANSHGTMVASIIAAKDNDRGYLGVAPDCELYAVRLDNGSGGSASAQLSAQVKGMDWAIENGIDVINCSFSGFHESQARRTAFKAAYDAGIAIFGSAGNRQNGHELGISRIGYPANYPFIITVANIQQDKTRHPSSSCGYQLNFSSGGVDVSGANISSANEVSTNYRSGTGTSYASPAVAGMYCLYKSMFPNDSREKLLQRMYVNAERLGSTWEYGAGLPKFPEIDFASIQVRKGENE